jgi:Tfp pilus assembly protein PilF
MEVLAGLNLAASQIELLDLDDAQQLLLSLSSHLSKMASSCLTGQNLTITASLYWRKRQNKLANDYFRSAFSQLENPSCREQKARACVAFGRFLKEQGNIKEAKDALQQGRELYLELNNQLGLKAIEKTLYEIERDSSIA